jgi:hypothetical protein
MAGWFNKLIVALLGGMPREMQGVPPPRRCPLNTPGDFYTTGECLACEAPELEAPDLLAPLGHGNYTTYFVKQPNTPAEVERACNAIQICCVADLRYGGKDRAIIERLGNDELHCDYIIWRNELIRISKAPAEPSAAPNRGGHVV